MANKTMLKKESLKQRNSTVKQVNNKNIEPDKVAAKKQKTQPNKASGIVVHAVERSAVNQLKDNYSWDVGKPFGLKNSWAINSYD